MNESEEIRNPASWHDELAELIERKKAENELLRKLQNMSFLSDNDPEGAPCRDAETGNEQSDQS